MSNNTLIDDGSLDRDFYQEVVQQNKKYRNGVLGLSLANFVCYPFLTIRTEASWSELFSLGAVTVGITLPIIFLLLGTLFSLLPYKGLPWKQRYWRAVLLIALAGSSVVFILFFLGGIINTYIYYVELAP